MALIVQNRGPAPPHALAPSAESAVPDQKQVLAGYAGSGSCKDCHQEEFEAWKVSHHGLAERLPSVSLDKDAFEPARTFQHGSQHTSVSWTNGVFEVEMLRATNSYQTFAVERVIGADPLRQFLVQFSGGRAQTLEAAYDPRRNEWFNVYGSEDRQPGEWGHWSGRGMNWNAMCAGCHNTRARKNYDESSDTYATAMAEISVGCEACHGPLKTHADWQKQYGKSSGTDPTVPRLARSQVTDNCGFCHARRGELTGDFKPGDAFVDNMRLSTVDATDMFYPDGQVREEDYEYAAFLGSRMHARGVHCVDCHEPHSARTRLPGNWLCLRCHSGSETNAPAINPSTHSHHQVFGFDENGQPTNLDLLVYNPGEIKQTGGECVNCHMPQTVYMQRHWRHDHGFTIPDPLLTKQIGIPNACNRCHQDKDAAWSLDWVQKWYGAKMDRPSRQRALIIAAARGIEPRARDGLLGLLAIEEVPLWRAAVAGLLEPWAAEPAVREALLGGLADTNAFVREASVRSLESLLETDATQVSSAITQRLEDSARNVRLAAAWALRASLDPSSKAGKELLAELDCNADQPVGQMQKAAYALARNQPQQAIAHYEKAMLWDPYSAAIHHELAIVLSNLGRSAEAVSHLESACALEPRNAEYRYLLALAYNEAGQAARTIEALEAAVQLDPRHARAWYNLGLALNGQGRPEEGLDALTRAEAVAPNDPRVPYARATILAQLGRAREARQAAKRALELQPNYAPAQELLQSLQ